MKPHPRLRKTIKWGGAAVTVVLVVAIAWSRSRYIEYCKAGYGIGLFKGTVVLSRTLKLEDLSIDEGWYRGGYDGPFKFWWSDWQEIAGRRIIDTVPMWPFATGASLVTIAAWRLDTLARRRIREGKCPKCNYDRVGLAAGAVCPECGEKPTVG